MKKHKEPLSDQKHLSAVELRKLPADERTAILMSQAALAEDLYRRDRQLTDFERMGRRTCVAMGPVPKRGEIWLVRFDPSTGAEIRKVCPAVVVNLDAIGRLPLRIVVPVTDWKGEFANLSWFVSLPATAGNGLSKDSGADAFQVKSVSETRFVRQLDNVTDAQMDEIAAAIAVCVGAP
jgi:mRNA interferase MazF